MYDPKTQATTVIHRKRVSPADRPRETAPAAPAPSTSPAASEERRSTRPEPDVPRGLCISCTLARTCTYRLGAVRPVIFCDEFDGIQAPVAMRRSEPIAASQLELGAESRARGLCATCVKRDSCTYPRPEGGVWHCEEFE